MQNRNNIYNPLFLSSKRFCNLLDNLYHLFHFRAADVWQGEGGRGGCVAFSLALPSSWCSQKPMAGKGFIAAAIVCHIPLLLTTWRLLKYSKKTPAGQIFSNYFFVPSFYQFIETYTDTPTLTPLKASLRWYNWEILIIPFSCQGNRLVDIQVYSFITGKYHFVLIFLLCSLWMCR